MQKFNPCRCANGSTHIHGYDFANHFFPSIRTCPALSIITLADSWNTIGGFIDATNVFMQCNSGNKTIYTKWVNSPRCGSE